VKQIPNNESKETQHREQNRQVRRNRYPIMH